MRLLLALALAMGCLAAPAAARENPARDLTRAGIPGAVVLSDDGAHAAGNVRADDRVRGEVPGYLAHADTDGRRSAVVLVTGAPLSKRQSAAVDRALDQALCS
jgi:hypothetical protein